MQQRGQWQPKGPSKQVRKALRQANSVYNLPSTKQAIKWMHAVCGYPVKSTWLKAIKAGNYVGWPNLNERNNQKYYPKTIEVAKGHLNQTRTCAPPKPKQRLWKLMTPPNSMVRKFKTSTPKHTGYTKPCSPIKQVNSLRVLNEATSTSWLWWKSTATPSLLSP
jgi:hypothetical protein